MSKSFQYQSDPSKSISQIAALVPGLVLTLTIALFSLFLHRMNNIGALSPLLLSITTGILIRNLLPLPASFQTLIQPGIAFSLKRLLRLGVVLLGLQLTLSQIGELGLSGVAIIVITVFTTFFVMKFVGRLIGVSDKLAELIAAGTSICGASAVLATDLVTRARDEDVAYAIACVTIFGTLSMLLYPLLMSPLVLEPFAYGLWTGASIHEVAQVVAAAFQAGSEAGHTGTVTKLGRVVLLAPLVFGLGFMRSKTASLGEGQSRPPIPWFVLGFVMMVVLNSVVTIPAAVTDALQTTTIILLSIALAAMGLETQIRKLLNAGFRPLALGAFGWVFISALALGLIKVAGL